MKILELGGGDNPRYCRANGNGENVDKRPGAKVDIVADLEEPIPLPSGEYDYIWTRYTIEHLSWRKARGFINELYRLLQPEGVLNLWTANFEAQCKKVVEGAGTFEYNSELVFGGQDYPDNTHKCGFTPVQLVKMFREAGFRSVELLPVPDCATDVFLAANKSILHRPQWIIDHCKPGEKILEIGSSTGFIFNSEPALWPTVTHIDLDVFDIDNFIQMDAGDLIYPEKSFPDQSFDVGVMGDVLEHVEDPVRVIRGALRVCKRILITVPNEYEWEKHLRPCETIEQALQREGMTIEQSARAKVGPAKQLYSGDGYKHLYHNRWYTRETLEADLKAAGLVTYTLEKLNYEGWAFFVVEGMSNYIRPPVSEPGPIQSTSTPEDRHGILPAPASIYPPESFSSVPIPLHLKIGLISSPFFGVPPKTYSGLEMVVWDLAQALAELGHEVTVFAPEGSQAPPGGHVVLTGPAQTSVQIDWVKAERDNYELYKDRLEDLDIINAHDWFGFEYLAKVNNPKLKVCHTHHGGINMDWWGKSKPPFKLNLIAISHWMQQVYEAQGFTSKYSYDGVDLQKYPMKREKGNRLLFVGRIDKFKQPHVAINVANKLGLGLDIVGGTFVQDKEYLEQIRNACTGRIAFYPDASQKTKIELMQNARCVIFPSAMGEPFGLVPVEAMACGTPVVALNDGAVEEVVKEGGIVVQAFEKKFIPPRGVEVSWKPGVDTAEAIASAIQSLNISPESCRANAERFSRTMMARRYLALYTQILQGDEW